MAIIYGVTRVGHRDERARTAPEGIVPGIERHVDVRLGDEHLTRHVGGRGVFATPAMIWLMESCAHDSVAPHLTPDQTTVGYEVHVFHRAPADAGDTITVSSRLVEVTRNRLTFEVSARLGETLLGDGTHRRAVVPART